MSKRVLRMGNRGAGVKDLQTALSDAGFYKSVVDGIYGPGTQKAVAAFQRSKGLVADGIAGSRTLAALGQLKGQSEGPPAWALTEEDMRRAAKSLGVNLAAVKAVAEVESSGYGFVKQGVPKVLFERHWMYRALINGGMRLLATIASKELPTLVNKEPGGYLGGQREWARFEKACQLNMNAAIGSTSWGRFQIMGVHASRCGYASAREFMDAMCKNEGEQLKAFVRFIRADIHLRKALMNQDWDVFAKRYNGPNYRQNSYDEKLAAAYEKYSKQL